jgi:transposase
MLKRWVKELQADEEEVFRGNGKLTAEQKDLRQLRAENKQLKLKREVLKKATAFFAKESS